ncbi:hypothetical protein IQ265_25165 [Nodosilinea sp. LEGE 06152]|uniref:hypothetical protein n=1 Tax=Nodosilinea sp. LEGE 06152 TaxID=2777966 RepID=UPI00187F46B4|nr:hypothetical protein [Nodosilinea sp. LEGE 06152]MBE9160089.1 hypothetical protein [Nodosilinea sp. LEGE 06152]
MNQNYLLYGSVGAAALGLFCGLQRPASNLTPADLEAFANGAQIRYEKTYPYLPAALVFGLVSVGCGVAWALGGEQPKVAIAGPPVQPEPQSWNGQVPFAGATESFRVGNPAAILAARMRPTLISANPRIGKGLTVAHAYRQAQVKQGAVVWVIQPKYHPKEHGYWEQADNVLGFMADSLESKEDIDDICEQMQKFIFAWRQLPQRPKVLIIDELAMMKTAFKSWYDGFLKSQLTMELSSGETDDRALWAITQSSLVGDIGVSGGMRATFDLLTIQTPSSQSHLESLRKSDTSIPPIEDEVIFERSFSPKQAVFYHSEIKEWLPMVAYEVPELSSASITSGITRGNHSAATDTAESVITRTEFQKASQGPDLPLIIAVTNALAQGLSRSKVIKEVLGYQGHKYQEGCDLFDRIKSIIEENS